MPAFEIARPEIFLLIALCVVLLLDLFIGKDSRVVTYLAAQASLLTTALLVYSSSFGRNVKTLGLEGMYIVDELGGVLKIGVLIISSLTFAYARKYLRDHDIWRGEFFVLGMSAVLGMLIMVSGYHLLVLYLGLELLALSMYALVAMHRDDGRATEAAMKYFVLGAVASGLLLYGISMLYGVSGHLRLESLNEFLAVQENIRSNLALMFALVFIVAGVAFKFGLVPFHMWVPDVYQGAPTAAAMFLASAPKIAAFALFMRLLAEGLESVQESWAQIFTFLGLLSVVIGNLVAIAQTSIKRMLAYSTIAHMGFVLMGAQTGSHEGYSAAMFYTLTYALTSLGAFAILIMLGRRGHEVDALDDLAGLNERHPWVAFMMLLLLLSMAGIPPTVGFYAKLTVIQAVVGGEMIWAAVMMVLMSVVGAFYYLRVIKVMYFDNPTDTQPLEIDMDFHILMGVNGLLVLILGFFPGFLMGLCASALTASQL